MAQRTTEPNVETLGYSQKSLRDFQRLESSLAGGGTTGIGFFAWAVLHAMKIVISAVCAMALAGAFVVIAYRVGHSEGVRSEREVKAERELQIGEARDVAVLALGILTQLETNDVQGVSTRCVERVSEFYHAFGPSTRPEWKGDIMYGDFLRRIEATAERLLELRRKLNEPAQ
jgi:hypothetical protein